jgi:hypothetical protein
MLAEKMGIPSNLGNAEVLEALAVVSDELAMKNISISADSLPKIPPGATVYIAGNALADKVDISSTVLGQDCYMKELNFYQNADYNLWVDNGDFDLLPIGFSYEPSVKCPSASAARRRAVAWLKKHDIWTKTSAVIGIARDEDRNEMVVAVADVLDNIRVLDSYISVWVSNDRIERVENAVVASDSVEANSSEESTDAAVENNADSANITASDAGIMRASGRNWLNTTYRAVAQEIRVPTIAEILAEFADAREDSNTLDISRIEFGYYIGERTPERKQIRMVPAVRLTTSEGEEYLKFE